MELKSVLVIEDNELNLKLIRTLLQIAQYEVHAAENAETGMQLAADKQPDLILMDVQLPGMDGLSAVRTMKENSRTRDIPVVVVTSCAMDGDEERVMAAGCIGYITKPIDTRMFVPTIQEYWEKRGGGS